ncbi:MAG: CarD family transcriptional regulator [Limnochordaceae bacterium]|nr:CarD family transcriptional regulator [Limnochordaceae bacterium]
MFKIGDKVVHPMHGAGIIEDIQEKEVLHEKHRYYVMRLPVGELKVLIPMDSAEAVGLRQVIDRSSVDQVLDILKGNTTGMSSNWNRRYRANLEKIRSGDIFEVAQVVKNLAERDREKGLSTGEKRMLESARQILLSELALAQDATEEEVATELEHCLG